MCLFMYGSFDVSLYMYISRPLSEYSGRILVLCKLFRSILRTLCTYVLAESE